MAAAPLGTAVGVLVLPLGFGQGITGVPALQGWLDVAVGLLLLGLGFGVALVLWACLRVGSSRG